MDQQERRDLQLLAHRVATRRAELRLEQQEVADKASLSRAYISRLETGGVQNPKLFDLAKVARALDLLASPDEPPPWSLERHLREQGVVEWLIFDALEAGQGEPEAIQRVLALQTVSINRRLRGLSDGQNPVNPQIPPEHRRHA